MANGTISIGATTEQFIGRTGSNEFWNELWRRLDPATDPTIRDAPGASTLRAMPLSDFQVAFATKVGSEKAAAETEYLTYGAVGGLAVGFLIAWLLVR